MATSSAFSYRSIRRNHGLLPQHNPRTKPADVERKVVHLRVNLDGRAVRRNSPQFFYVLVRKSYTPQGPIPVPIHIPRRFLPVGESVNHNVGSGRYTTLG